MTQEEYNRMREYEKLEWDAKTLSDAALIIENPRLVPYSDERKNEIVINAMGMCRTALAELFRNVACAVRKEMEKLCPPSARPRKG